MVDSSAQGPLLGRNTGRGEYIITVYTKATGMKVIDRFARVHGKQPEKLAAERLRKVLRDAEPGVEAQVWLRCPAIEEVAEKKA